MVQSCVLELNNGLLPHGQRNGLFCSNFVQRIICTEHVQHLLQTGAGCAYLGGILRSSDGHYIVEFRW